MMTQEDGEGAKITRGSALVTGCLGEQNAAEGAGRGGEGFLRRIPRLSAIATLRLSQGLSLSSPMNGAAPKRLVKAVCGTV